MAGTSGLYENTNKLIGKLQELNEASCNLTSLSNSLGPRHIELNERVNECYSRLENEMARAELENLAQLLVTTVDQIGMIRKALEAYQVLLLDALKELNSYMIAISESKFDMDPSPFDSGISLSSNGSSSWNVSADDVKRRAKVESTIVSPEQNESNFEKIVGLASAKKIIRQALLMPLYFPNLFNGVNVKPWTRILLFGPPGTGKTEMARALAAEISAVFFSISSSDIVSCMLGESERFIKEIFSCACSLKRHSVIFIDEIDSLARSRSSTEDEHNRRLKTELLVQLSQLERRPVTEPPVIFICATNLPWEIDCGIMRRFQKRIYIPLPNNEARCELLKKQSHSVGAELNDKNLEELVIATAGFTPHDIVNFVQDAFFQRVAEIETAHNWIFDTRRNLWMPCDVGQSLEAVECNFSNLPPALVAPRPPDMSNFRTALASAKPTVAKELVARFDEFTQKFGINGE